MKYIILLFSLVIVACGKTNPVVEEKSNDYNPKAHYTKKEITIPMRDGIKLHATIYAPKDTSKTYPILLKRTPYSSRPYGPDEFAAIIGPNETLMKEGNIVVIEDVRGRWNSEGTYDNMRAYIPNKKEGEVDEASDTYDTIDWLINNVEKGYGEFLILDFMLLIPYWMRIQR